MNARDQAIAMDAAMDQLDLLFAIRRRSPETVTRGQLRLAVLRAAIAIARPSSDLPGPDPLDALPRAPL